MNSSAISRVAGAVSLALAGLAHAGVQVDIGVGLAPPPVYYGPPVEYSNPPPPVYYGPSVVYPYDDWGYGGYGGYGRWYGHNWRNGEPHRGWDRGDHWRGRR